MRFVKVQTIAAVVLIAVIAAALLVNSAWGRELEPLQVEEIREIVEVLKVLGEWGISRNDSLLGKIAFEDHGLVIESFWFPGTTIAEYLSNERPLRIPNGENSFRYGTISDELSDFRSVFVLISTCKLSDFTILRCNDLSERTRAKAPGFTVIHPFNYPFPKNKWYFEGCEGPGRWVTDPEYYLTAYIYGRNGERTLFNWGKDKLVDLRNIVTVVIVLPNYTGTKFTDGTTLVSEGAFEITFARRNGFWRVIQLEKTSGIFNR